MSKVRKYGASARHNTSRHHQPASERKQQQQLASDLSTLLTESRRNPLLLWRSLPTHRFFVSGTVQWICCCHDSLEIGQEEAGDEEVKS